MKDPHFEQLALENAIERLACALLKNNRSKDLNDQAVQVIEKTSSFIRARHVTLPDDCATLLESATHAASSSSISRVLHQVQLAIDVSHRRKKRRSVRQPLDQTKKPMKKDTDPLLAALKAKRVAKP